jgi:hypothetical protein
LPQNLILSLTSLPAFKLLKFFILLVKKTWKTNGEVSKCVDIFKTIVLTLASAIQKSQIKHKANKLVAN